MTTATTTAKMIAPYGSWPSPISADLLSAQNIRLAEPCLDGEHIYWLESRPHEQGRNALVHEYRGQRRDLLAAPHSVRSRAHEYGGGHYCVAAGNIFLVLQADQRIYHLDSASGQLTPLTPAGDFRYADMCFDAARQRLICVREDHTLKNKKQAHEETNTLVAINVDGSETVSVLVAGANFYSNPRLSPCGQKLSWLSWNHPAMPWDNTQCYIAELDELGVPHHVTLVAGGTHTEPAESIFQPQWSANGDLYLVSDRSNWWNLYRYRDGELQCVLAMAAEFATPQWAFGMSTYGFINDTQILATFSQDGYWHLCMIDTTDNALTRIQTRLTEISAVVCNNNRALFIGGAATIPAQIYQWSPSSLNSLTAAALPFDADNISLPQALTFATANQQQAHGVYYPPTNAAYAAPAESLPPLIVLSHGGPTGATESGFNLKVQYWTSRGFAVLDVNYRGSTGYGRRYRQLLHGTWGIADVEDVCAGAEYLVAQGLANPEQLAIKGSSAGGYTVLAALAFRDTFKAGASLYGIGDLETLAQDTHKFEARYLDSLVGPYPEAAATYRARSPIHHLDQFNCPIIFFQGLDDKVVPPNQAEAMVTALDNKGIPVAYIPFRGEGHGFRQGPNIQRALEAEYYFYSQIFGFSCDPTIEAVAIRNFD